MYYKVLGFYTAFLTIWIQIWLILSDYLAINYLAVLGFSLPNHSY
ncbi:hypothetical protein ENHAE0001_2391 [Enhydrobacter aerosaccus SK60]|nr:hypothetical protein ENHAE0001_2391 [Enhydrobacter aerosaccus SK60]